MLRKLAQRRLESALLKIICCQYLKLVADEIKPKYFYSLEFLLLSKGSILLMHAYNHAFWVTNTPLKGAGRGILYFLEKWGQTSGLYLLEGVRRGVRVIYTGQYSVF